MQTSVMWYRLVVSSFVFINIVQSERQKYTTKWDGINVDEIIQSERLLKNYHLCLLEKGSCTAPAVELKKNLADALQQDCSRCSRIQRENITKVVRHLIEKRRKMWEELEERYDPMKIYYNKHYGNNTEAETLH